MEYSQYTDNSTTVSESMLEMSDGVSLKMIDFTPQNISQKKPVIIFVAGWISLISGWKGALKVLTSEYRVIYLDSREKQPSVILNVKKVNFSMKRLKLDLKEVIEKVVPPQREFILAGSSLGATTILEYCGTESRKPSSAILVAPNNGFKFPKIPGLIITVIHPSLYIFIKPFIKWYIRNFRLDKKNNMKQVEKYENTLDFADPYKLKRNALALKNYSLLESIKNIDIPCLIIGATTDKLHGTDDIRRILRILPYSTYIELTTNDDTHSEKAGHIIADYIQSN